MKGVKCRSRGKAINLFGSMNMNVLLLYEEKLLFLKRLGKELTTVVILAFSSSLLLTIANAG